MSIKTEMYVATEHGKALCSTNGDNKYVAMEMAVDYFTNDTTEFEEDFERLLEEHPTLKIIRLEVKEIKEETI